MGTDDRMSVLLIGGQDAGKSNFLFRLWLAIEDGRGALMKGGLPQELEYLRTGATCILDGSFAGHTPKEVRERVDVPVSGRDLRAALHGVLTVPDMAGERILAIYKSREWSHEWEELISPHCACLLFIRADSDQNVAPLDWAMCFEAYGATIGPPDPSDQRREDDKKNPGELHGGAGPTVHPPTQVVLTEWLQFLRRAFTSVVGGAFRPRVGVVVSAWDLVPADQQPAGPAQYIRANFPMLHQFIEASTDRFDFHVFAVSVVAGDLKDDEFKETYLNGRPQDFGFVMHSLAGQLEMCPDITLPVAWALGALPRAS
jgi:hypothetical protein